ncbi:hypothetical protein BDR07DRAFT_1425676 [Suillus spraguei]|nr:hypothetical protein BDR07DRAFT_1425676 [Suillus spraguei]
MDTEMDLIRNFHIQESEFPLGGSLNHAFQCLWEDCSRIVFLFHLPAHLRGFHGNADTMHVNCLWDYCNMKLRKHSLVRHVHERHLCNRYSSV